MGVRRAEVDASLGDAGSAMDGGDESVVIGAGEADRIEMDPDHEVVGAG